jgi:thiol-disulfide isomerase/thioredoxin
MKGGKTKKQKSSRSVMGRLLPPIDVQNENQIEELSKRINLGPVTLVLIYADWCGHCQHFKPTMEKLENMPGRTVQTARVRDDILPKTPLSSAKIEGYPTLMLVKKNGEIATFKNDDGEVSNAIPDHTDINKMSIIVRNAGKEEGVSLMENSVKENSPQENTSQEKSALQVQSNQAVNPSQEVPKMPKNILADRMTPESVERLNQNLINASSSLLKEAAAPVKGNKQTGGGLYSQLLLASQEIAVPAALFLGSQAFKKSKRKTRGGMINTAVLPSVQNIATPVALYAAQQSLNKSRRNRRSRKGGMINAAVLPSVQNIATPVALYAAQQSLNKSRRSRRSRRSARKSRRSH